MNCAKRYKTKQTDQLSSILFLKTITIKKPLSIQTVMIMVKLWPTCEAALAPFLATGDSEELVSEQVQSSGSAVWVRLKAAQDEGLGLQGHGLWDLWVDLEHPHL